MVPGAPSSSSPDTMPTDMGAQFMMASNAASASMVPNMQAILARAHAAQQSHSAVPNIPNSLTGEHVPILNGKDSDTPSSPGNHSNRSDSLDSPPALRTSLDSSLERREIERMEVTAS